MSLHWITDCAGPGRLAVAPRPRGGDWLDDEMKQWRREGADVVVSAMEDAEIKELGLAREGETAGTAGLAFMRFPIPDRGTPASLFAATQFVHEIVKLLDGGKAVVVHCRAGLGRSALLAASMLIARGVSADEAIARVSAARGCPVPETDAQRGWLTLVDEA